jgi:hypothetical protein
MENQGNKERRRDPREPLPIRPPKTSRGKCGSLEKAVKELIKKEGSGVQDRISEPEA